MKCNNITYEKYYSEFNNLYDKVKNLNDKIKEEIKCINKHRKNVLRKINKSFDNERFIINRRQILLKDELNSKIDDTIDELKEYLDESDEIISKCERIKESFDKFHKQIEKPLIKTLNYISAINKNNIKIKEFITEQKSTLSFSFDDSNNSLKSINYYFSGLPIPEDIKVEINDEDEVAISWKINKNKIKEDDRNKLLYSVEIKNDNNYYSFKSAETKLVLKNVKYDCDYKIRIKSYLNKSYSEYSQIKEFNMEDIYE